MDGARIRLRRPGCDAMRAAFVAVALLVSPAADALAAAPATVQGQTGTTSNAAKQDAIAHLPINKLNAASRAKVEHVLEDAAMYRQLPVSVCRCDPKLYLLLVNRPDTVVNIWEVLGISQFDLRQIGPSLYQADDGTGMQTTVEFLHRSTDAHVAYVEGMYQGPLLSRKIKAECVLFLRSAYTPDEDGSWIITHRLDAFVRFDALGAEMLARTMNSMIGKIADRNFREVSNFVTNLYTRAENDPEWTADLAGKLENVRPEVRDQFAKVTADIGARGMEESAPTVARTASRAEPEETTEPSRYAPPAMPPRTVRSSPLAQAATPGPTPAPVEDAPPAALPQTVSTATFFPPPLTGIPTNTTPDEIAPSEDELDWETEKAPIARAVGSRMAAANSATKIDQPAPAKIDQTPVPERPAPVRVDVNGKVVKITPNRSAVRQPIKSAPQHASKMFESAAPAETVEPAPVAPSGAVDEPAAETDSPAKPEAGPAFPE